MTDLEFQVEACAGDFHLEASGRVEAGTCTAVLGPSGSGKSTLLRVLAGLMEPVSGSIRSGEKLWYDRSAGVDLAPEERRCALLFQDYALFPTMTASQNVAYGIQGPRDYRRTAARRIMDGVGVGHLEHRMVRSLSGGERQRVALARSLASNPDLLLLDEPFSALDPTSRRTAMSELGTTLDSLDLPTMMVTHDLGEATRFGDRILVLEAGSVVQEGPARSVVSDPGSPFMAGISGEGLARGTARPAGRSRSLVVLSGGQELLVEDEARGPVVLAVSPGDIGLFRLGGEPAGDQVNLVETRVGATYDAGGRTRVELRGLDGLEAEVMESGAIPEVGEKVGVAIPPGSVRLFPVD